MTWLDTVWRGETRGLRTRRGGNHGVCHSEQLEVEWNKKPKKSSVWHKQHFLNAEGIFFLFLAELTPLIM